MFSMPKKFRLSVLLVFAFFTVIFTTNQKTKAEDQRRYVYASGDATVYSGASSQNYGNYAYLETSYESANSRQEMVFFKFDSLGIPANATIINAKLWLKIKSCNGTVSPNILSVGKVNGGWVENSITWSNRPSYTAGNTLIATCRTDWPFDVTDTVRNWVLGTSENYGLVVYGPKAGTWERNFYSRENDSESNKPQLAIYYTLPSDQPAPDPDTQTPDPDDNTGDTATPPATPGPSTSTPPSSGGNDNSGNTDTDNDADNDDSLPQFLWTDDANRNNQIEDIFAGTALSPIFSSVFNMILCLCCPCSCILLVLFLVIIFLKKGKKKQGSPSPSSGPAKPMETKAEENPMQQKP